jgi:hypothetical protein
MKAFFRAVLQIKYTENPDKLDFPSLRNYLLDNKLIAEDFGI